MQLQKSTNVCKYDQKYSGAFEFRHFLTYLENTLQVLLEFLEYRKDVKSDIFRESTSGSWTNLNPSVKSLTQTDPQLKFSIVPNGPGEVREISSYST